MPLSTNEYPGVPPSTPGLPQSYWRRRILKRLWTEAPGRVRVCVHVRVPLRSQGRRSDQFGELWCAIGPLCGACCMTGVRGMPHDRCTLHGAWQVCVHLFEELLDTWQLFGRAEVTVPAPPTRHLSARGVLTRYSRVLMGQSQVTAYSRHTHRVPAPPPRHLPAAPYNVQHAAPARQLAPTCRHGMASTMTVREAPAAVTMPSILPGTRPTNRALLPAASTRHARPHACGQWRTEATGAHTRLPHPDSPTTSRFSPRQVLSARGYSGVLTHLSAGLVEQRLGLLRPVGPAELDYPPLPMP